MQEARNVGETADDKVISGLLSLPDKSLIIQSQSGKIGSLKEMGRSFRKFCKDKGHRFVSTMSLGDIDTYLLKRVIQPMMVDYDNMKKNHMKLKMIFE